MKIGPIESKPAATGSNAADRSKSAAAPGPISNAPESSAKVDLSPAASSAASTAATGTSGDGSFDSAKVDRIAQAIRDGKFSVNAEAIADKLIINAEELLGRKLSS